MSQGILTTGVVLVAPVSVLCFVTPRNAPHRFVPFVWAVFAMLVHTLLVH